MLKELLLGKVVAMQRLGYRELLLLEMILKVCILSIRLTSDLSITLSSWNAVLRSRLRLELSKLVSRHNAGNMVKE